MLFDITLSSPTPKSFRAAKVEGMFDVPHAEEQRVRLAGDIPLESLGDWSVGAIVGASGAGKSSVATEVFGPDVVKGFDWREDCLLDDFGPDLTPKEIVLALSSVGLSSPPVWLRPYRVLSTGQKFRADLARALIENKGVVVYDEFTSVVDRQVAKATSVSVAKHVRRYNRRFVGVSCHKDILPWLEPDWVFDVDTMDFSKERLRRPELRIEIREGKRTDWPRFRGICSQPCDVAA